MTARMVCATCSKGRGRGAHGKSCSICKPPVDHVLKPFDVPKVAMLHILREESNRIPKHTKPKKTLASFSSLREALEALGNAVTQDGPSGTQAEI